MLLGWGRSHRTTSDGELIRWGHDLARVEGHVGDDVLEVAVARSGADGSGGRKRIRVNGIGRRATALGRILRVVLFAPEEMLLVVGAPTLRRAALDALAAARSPAYADDLATYGRTLQQRNSLLRAIREEQATRDQLRLLGHDVPGGRRSRWWKPATATPRRASPSRWQPPIARSPRTRRPPARSTLRYVTNAPASPGETPRGCARATARRDGRQGGLERLHPDRSASRRPRLRPRLDATSRRSPRADSSGRPSSRSSWPSWIS